MAKLGPLDSKDSCFCWGVLDKLITHFLLLLGACDCILPLCNSCALLPPITFICASIEFTDLPVPNFNKSSLSYLLYEFHTLYHC